MPSSPQPPDRARPTDRPAVVDEWGMYDPQQAGFDALVEAIEARRRAAEPADASETYSRRAANRLLTAVAADTRTPDDHK